MLDTALRQLRHGLAVTAGRRIRVADVEGLVADLRATLAEFGSIDQAQVRTSSGQIDPELRRDIDARRWRRVVATAYRRTRYYRERLDELGLSPRDLTLNRRHELPPTPKSALRERPTDFVSSAVEPVLHVTTTGSTSLPTSCWFTGYELDLAAAYQALALMVGNGLRHDDVVQICVSSRSTVAVQTMLRSLRLIGATGRAVGTVDPGEALAMLAAPSGLPGRKQQPSMLVATASYLGALVDAAGKRGYAAGDFGLAQVLCGGEVLSRALRERVERTFGATVSDNYSMTEVFPVGGATCSAGHLHFAAETGLVEVLDPVTYAPTAPGEVGTLVITPFLPYREATMVLRMATGDLVRVLAAPPSCELAAQPATSPLLGRVTQVAPGRSTLHQRDLLELLDPEPALPQPVRYGLQPADDGFDLHVLGPEDDPALVQRIEVRAAQRGLAVRKVVPHRSLDEVPDPQFVRALLREAVITRTAEGGGAWCLR